MTKLKIMKNKVSDFEAGFRAGLILGGLSKEFVDERFYTTLFWPDLMREILLAYDKEEYANEAIEAAEKLSNIKKEELLKVYE